MMRINIWKKYAKKDEEKIAAESQDKPKKNIYE